MRRGNRIDPIPALGIAVGALAERGQPRPLFAALDRLLGELIGHKLFSIMVLHPVDGTSERLYSTNEHAYPIGGRKAMHATPFGAHVFEGHKPYVGRNAADIRWAFPDHELIASLGLASVVNTPVIHDGVCLGTMNLLHEAGWYDDDDPQTTRLFAALLVPALLGRR